MDKDGWGDVGVNDEKVDKIWLPFTLLRFAFTMILMVLIPVAAALWDIPVDPLRGLIAGGGFIAYLAIAYFVRIRPNYDNLGLAGGLIDHPFKWGDDWNRELFSYQMLLFPGYVLARPLVEMFYWLAGEAEAG